MKSTAILLALGLALVLPAGAGNRDPSGQARPKRSPQQVFKKKDRDGDGFLSRAEFTARTKDAAKAEASFTRKDKNSDGKLSLAEFRGKRGAKGQADKAAKGRKKAKAANAKAARKAKAASKAKARRRNR